MNSLFTFIYMLGEEYEFEAPYYEVFSILLLFHPSSVKVIFSTPLSQIISKEKVGLKFKIFFTRI
jgi:hypothetical protein